MGRRLKTTSRQMLLLCGIVLGMAGMAMQSCSEAARDDRPALCGNWESVEGKPDVPKQLISKYGISRLRVYCSIDNLFMISGFDGVDPEAISGNYYPLTRNYSFGLNVTF